MKALVTPLLALALLAGATPTLAASGSDSSKGELSSTVLSCLKSAVATRESSLKSGWNAFADAVEDAYADRASALDAAYASGQTRAEVKADVKAAWKTFKSDIKEARADWKEARKDAWSTYKSSAKTCKAPSDVVESGEGTEVSGN